MLNKIHAFVSWSMIIAVALAVAVIELPIKIAGFLLIAVSYLILVIIAPLTRHWLAPKWVNEFVEWGLSPKFVWTIKAMRAYHRVLLG
jgi:hypothetical protein